MYDLNNKEETSYINDTNGLPPSNGPLSTCSLSLNGNSTEKSSTLLYPQAHQSDVVSQELLLKYAVSSISQQIAFEHLESTINRLDELSLNHSVQIYAKKIRLLLKQFTGSPSVKDWRQLSSTIKKLTECNPIESSDLLKQHELISQYYEHFFNLDQKSTDASNIVECYEGYKLTSESLLSREIPLPACLVHSVIGRTYIHCSQFLNSVISKRVESLPIDSLINDQEKSDIYKLFCGQNSIANNFSIQLNAPRPGECAISLLWNIPEELVDDFLDCAWELMRKVEEINRSLKPLGIFVKPEFDDNTLALDILFPSTESMPQDDPLRFSPSVVINLSNALSFTYEGISISGSQDILRAHPREVGEAIKNTMALKKRFSSEVSNLYFFSLPDRQEPFVQLLCPPLKVSLPLQTFCNSTSFVIDSQCRDALSNNGQNISKVSFVDAIHDLDNTVTIKNLALGYNTLSDDFQTASIINALSAYANAANKTFPKVGLTLDCKKDQSGEVIAKIGFSEQELNSTLDDGVFCPGYAFYDKHGFFRGVLETKDTAKALAKLMRNFPSSMPASEIAKKLEKRGDTTIRFSKNFLTVWGKMTNRDLTNHILSNAVEWCSKKGKSGNLAFFIGMGRAFIPNSWDKEKKFFGD